MSSFRTALFDAVYDWILENDFTPYILADTSSSTVSVPREYTHNGRIILNIHPHSIDGLIVDEDGISFMARFNGVSRPVVREALPVAEVVLARAAQHRRELREVQRELLPRLVVRAGGEVTCGCPRGRDALACRL